MDATLLIAIASIITAGVTISLGSVGPALAEAAAIAKVRDLVNTPAQDMGPAELEGEAEALAKKYATGIEVKPGEIIIPFTD